MANVTDPFAQTIHGTNPQFLIEKITRLKIYNSSYWKEECFGLTAETIIEKAVALKYIGGTYGGNIKPSKFLCLILKMLQLQPEKEIVIELILNEDFKYVRALGVMYMRLIGKTEDIFKYLEPLYNDFRKLAYRGMSGWSIMHMDDFIDALLRDELVCDIALPHLVKRMKLEELGVMQERASALDLDMLDVEESDEEPEKPVTTAPSAKLPPGVVETAPAAPSAAAVVFDDDDDEEGTVPVGAATVASSSRPSQTVEPVREGVTSVRVESKPADNSSSKQFTRNDRDDDRKESRSRRSSSRDHHDRDRRRDDSRDRRDRRSGGADDRDRRRGRSDSRDRGRGSDRGGGGRRRDDSRDRRDDRRRYSEDSDSEEEEDRRRRRRGRDDSRDRGRDRHYSDDEERDHKKHRRGDSPPYEQSEGKKTTTASTSSSSAAATAAPVAAPTKPQNNGKLFDRMFGKKKAGSGSGAGKVVVNTKGEKVEITAAEGTVEYWNQIRESLGMSKLK